MESFEVASLGLEELYAPPSCREVSVVFRIEVSVNAGFSDPEGDRLEKDIRDIGIATIKQARVSDVYLLEGELSEAEVVKLGRELLADTIVGEFPWGRGPSSSDVVIKPGALNEPNVALYYADERGDIRAGYPRNPNGSVNNIAAICDGTGRIFALMPHPERFIRWTQHPRWTREPRRDYGDGFRIFLNAVEWAKSI